MTNSPTNGPKGLRKIPSVTELLESPPLKGLIDRVSRTVVVDGVRSFLSDFRSQIHSRANQFSIPSVSELAARIAGHILADDESSLRPVINATGILLHTGLGRAPLAEKAIEYMGAVARDYASVEVDLRSGERSQRVEAVSGLLCQLTGAEAALVVNNNAGATLLALASLAQGREVIVSRGELIEIGGSFRLPDVMTVSGARLREVGTTNRTRISDYASAIGEGTAALLRAHSSNFRIVGFTEKPALADLVELAHRHELPMMDDIGSGALIDFSRFGLTSEPSAAASINEGADLVLFSGDKLLGGPQCGVIVGKRAFVDRLACHPLARALRVDKLTLAALAATLRLLRDEPTAFQEVPLLQLLAAPVENLRQRAERLATQIAALEGFASAEACESAAFLGGGSVPEEQIASWCIALAPSGMSVEQFARRLRGGTPPVVGRIHADRLRLEMRSVFPRQDAELLAAVAAVGGAT
jgi:L-seryl-tRNA(Ser) seleniumtransferase